MKKELHQKIVIEFVALRAKICSCLVDGRSEDKKAKGTKKCFTKRKLKFEDHENCFEATQLDNKKHYLEKNEISVEVLEKGHKELKNKQNNKLMLKTQQIFKSERYIYFK